MLLKKLKTIDVEGLSSTKHLQLLNSIDKLRSQGIDHYISLPQIVVCGDQSSGKSSVLEAISGVPFPVKSNLCTRFPIELVLRKTPHTGIRVSIIRHQDDASDNTNRSSIAEFEEKLDSYEDLPSLIEAAKTAMGVVTYGKTFSKDTLHIEISGPNHPHLTIVDLPGLIHSETKHQSASDVELIQGVVQRYMKKPRTIILAVVSAKNDYANQIVLKLARLADPNGNRTLGVITKPDTLLPGSLSERTYISLARNREIEFRLGWHVLKNMDSEAGICSLLERDAHETQFFSGGTWADLPEGSLGIKKLRDRLSDLLFNQIAVELPRLIEEIEEKTVICQESLRRLGRPRITTDEQRVYVFEVSDSFNKLLKAAIDGNYDASFFGNAETASGYQRYLRAVIQNLNDNFAVDITEKGRRYEVTSDPDSKATSGGQQLLTREEFTIKVVNLMQRSRGRELSGMFDPMIVSKLFREQSSPWTNLVMAHVKNVWTAAKVFLKQLTTHVADASTIQAMLRLIIEPKLSEILILMRERTRELIQPHQNGHPITYNLSFLDTVARIRSDRNSAQIWNVLKKFGRSSSVTLSPRPMVSDAEIDLHTVHRAILDKVVEEDEKRHVASQVLDYVEAYYQVSGRCIIYYCS
jgi:GTPase SAR1 family protein